jgi:hypothetical protein
MLATSLLILKETQWHTTPYVSISQIIKDCLGDAVAIEMKLTGFDKTGKG